MSLANYSEPSKFNRLSENGVFSRDRTRIDKFTLPLKRLGIAVYYLSCGPSVFAIYGRRLSFMENTLDYLRAGIPRSPSNGEL
jgi:hypothetical protein